MNAAAVAAHSAVLTMLTDPCPSVGSLSAVFGRADFYRLFLIRSFLYLFFVLFFCC